MKRLNRIEVELTDAEQIIEDWFNDLLDQGYGMNDALAMIEGRGAHIPQGLKSARSSTLIRAIQNTEFRHYLLGIDKYYPTPEETFGWFDANVTAPEDSTPMMPSPTPEEQAASIDAWEETRLPWHN